MEKINTKFLNIATEIANSIILKIEKLFEYIHLHNMEEREYSVYLYNGNKEVVMSFHHSLSYSYNDSCCGRDLADFDANFILRVFSPIEIDKWANISEITLYKKDDDGIPIFKNPISIPV